MQSVIEEPPSGRIVDLEVTLENPLHIHESYRHDGEKWRLFGQNLISVSTTARLTGLYLLLFSFWKSDWRGELRWYVCNLSSMGNGWCKGWLLGVSLVTRRMSNYSETALAAHGTCETAVGRSTVHGLTWGFQGKLKVYRPVQPPWIPNTRQNKSKRNRLCLCLIKRG